MDIETLLPPAVLTGERPLTSDEWGDLLDQYLDLEDLGAIRKVLRYAALEDQDNFHELITIMGRK